jgi:hypothetical protein
VTPNLLILAQWLLPIRAAYLTQSRSGRPRLETPVTQHYDRWVAAPRDIRLIGAVGGAPGRIS